LCKQKVLSRYAAQFAHFTHAIGTFVADLDRYRHELDTLMVDHFEIFNSA
jgi:hypothetical protein